MRSSAGRADAFSCSKMIRLELSEVGHKTKSGKTVLDGEYYLCISIWLQCTDVVLETNLFAQMAATKNVFFGIIE